MNFPAFLLTAGQGTRLRPWTETKAKPSLPFINLPLMGFGYFLCRQAGITDYAFNLHHLPDSVKTVVQSDLPLLENPYFSSETSQLLGSGGALWKAREFLKNYPGFLVANGDEVLIPEDSRILKYFLQEFQRTQPLAQLLVMEHPDLLKNLKPVWVDDGNNVIAFGMERPKTPCRPVHYTGYKAFSNKIFQWLPEGESNIFYEVLTAAIAAGEPVKVMEFKNIQWFETGTIPKYFEATSACLQLLAENHHYLSEVFQFFGNKPEELEIRDTENAWICFPKGEEPPESLQPKGTVVIGSSVQIGDGVVLDNVLIEPGVRIESGAHIKNQIVFAGTASGATPLA